MRNILYILLLSAFSLNAQYSCNQVQPQNLGDTVLIFIKDGQSNSVGQMAAKNGGLTVTPNEYKYTQDSIRINYEGTYLTYDSSITHFPAMKVNTNTSDQSYTNPASAGYNIGNWSVEQSCLRQIPTIIGQKIYFIQNGIGAIDIRQWNSPSGLQWIKLKRYIKHLSDSLIVLGKVPKFVSLAWQQGESDILNNQLNWYGTRLKTLITNVRAINQYTDSIQFVLFRMKYPSTNGSYPNDSVAKLNASIDSVAGVTFRCESINTNSQTMYSYPHYDVLGMINMGYLWFAELYPLIVYRKVKIINYK